MLQPMNVIARFTEKHPIGGKVLEINTSGLTVQLDSTAPKATHLWLLIGLPDGSGDCLALGEILESESLDLRIRFKHLFPNDRRALHRSIGSSDAEIIAA